MTFTLNKKEEQKYNRWILSHGVNCSLGREQAYSFIFTGTGIGNNIKVMCPRCKKTKDITDYTSW